MFTIVTLIGLVGYGVGIEGFMNGKLYIGAYTPQCEYGYVITQDEIYLDTILEKNNF